MRHPGLIRDVLVGRARGSPVPTIFKVRLTSTLCGLDMRHYASQYFLTFILKSTQFLLNKGINSQRLSTHCPKP